MIAPVGSARVIAGRISDSGPVEPSAGNSRSWKENTWISSRPTQNVGREIPSGGSESSSWLSARARVYVPSTAIPPPKTTASTSASPVTASVGGSADSTI
jgi:hypothetical protein